MRVQSTLEDSVKTPPVLDGAAKTRALFEAVGVFVVALIAVAFVTRSPVAEWQRDFVGRPYAEYIALALVPLASILLTRRPLSSFGIVRHDLAGQFDAAFKCLLPFGAGKALVFFLGPRQLLHSFAEPLVALGVIAACAWWLRPRTSPAAAGIFLALPFLPHFSASALVFYSLFLGPAEELLFRGYIQSRLNQAFGRPYRAAGAAFGSGLFVSAGLFSLFHVINLPALAAGRIEPLWLTAVPTLAWGLALGYVRDRTDSLLPPAIVHGVPQAIAWAFLGR